MAESGWQCKKGVCRAGELHAEDSRKLSRQEYAGEILHKIPLAAYYSQHALQRND